MCNRESVGRHKGPYRCRGSGDAVRRLDLGQGFGYNGLYWPIRQREHGYLPARSVSDRLTTVSCSQSSQISVHFESEEAYDYAGETVHFSDQR